jgi:hypothetical protein
LLRYGAVRWQTFPHRSTRFFSKSLACYHKEIDILEKNEFELDPKKISDSLDMHLSREVSSLTKSKRSLKLKEILVIERESTMLGNSHPEILFLEKS